MGNIYLRVISSLVRRYNGIETANVLQRKNPRGIRNEGVGDITWSSAYKS